jgi:2-aminoadipate transaminase
MFANRMNRVAPSAIMELIKTTAAGDYISFASGLPDPSLFPTERLREITDDVLTRDGRAALQYGAAEGYGPLRDLVAGLLRERGLPATPEHVLITNGSQQGLDLAARALLEQGDPVVIESPSYLAAVQAFDSYDAAYRTVPMDDEGMVTGALPQALPGAKLLYTLPNFQNPTGLTLSLERRRAVAEAAAGAGVAVLEDDAYHDLRYEGEALPPVCALAPNPWAIYTGTFSKTVAPGLRVGYVYGEPGVVTRLAQLKQITDLHTGSLTQRVVHEYCARGFLGPGIRGFCESYRARRDVMLNALDKHLEGLATWTRPAGGMFVWVVLTEGWDAGDLLARAMARGVVFVPGASFHPDGRGQNTFRLNFVSATEDRIREGIAILGQVVGELLA